MYKYNGIKIMGKKPTCIRRSICPYFNLTIGFTHILQKIIKPIFFCSLGQYKMTRLRERVKYNKCRCKRLRASNREVGDE